MPPTCNQRLQRVYLLCFSSKDTVAYTVTCSATVHVASLLPMHARCQRSSHTHTHSLSIDALIAPATPLHLHQKQHTSHTSLTSQPTHRNSTTVCCLSPKHATIATAKLRFVRDERETSPKRARAKYTKICKACLREMCMQYTKSMNTRNIQTYKTQIHMHIYLYLCVHTYNKHQESRGLQRQTSLRGSLRTKCPCLKSKKHTYTTTPTHSRGCTQCILGITKWNSSDECAAPHGLKCMYVHIDGKWEGQRNIHY